MLVHCMIQPEQMAVTFNGTKDIRKKKRLQELLSVTESENKNTSGNLPELVVPEWNWKKAKKSGSFALNTNIITEPSSKLCKR